MLVLGRSESRRWLQSPTLFEVKSTGSELAFIRVYTSSTDFGRLRTSPEDLGRLRESSEMIVPSSKIPALPG